MPRVVELTVPVAVTEDVLAQLHGRDEVLSLRVMRGVSLQPPGDVIVAEVLDSHLSQVMRRYSDISGRDGR